MNNELNSNNINKSPEDTPEIRNQIKTKIEEFFLKIDFDSIKEKINFCENELDNIRSSLHDLLVEIDFLSKETKPSLKNDSRNKDKLIKSDLDIKIPKTPNTKIGKTFDKIKIKNDEDKEIKKEFNSTLKANKSEKEENGTDKKSLNTKIKKPLVGNGIKPKAKEAEDMNLKKKEKNDFHSKSQDINYANIKQPKTEKKEKSDKQYIQTETNKEDKKTLTSKKEITKKNINKEETKKNINKEETKKNINKEETKKNIKVEASKGLPEKTIKSKTIQIENKKESSNNQSAKNSNENLKNDFKAETIQNDHSEIINKEESFINVKEEVKENVENVENDAEEFIEDIAKTESNE